MVKAVFVSWLVLVLIHVTHGQLGPKIILHKQNGGDIGQFRDFFRSGAGRQANALPPTSRFKWSSRDGGKTFTIPYNIGGPFDTYGVHLIIGAMIKIEQNTCIKFVQKTIERDFINIENRQGDGCYSYVGNHGGKSPVNLENSFQASCVYPDIVIHELLHSVGLWHEHMRYDRNHFITVHWENIANGMKPQFARISRKEGVTYGVPYDYRSVMHYDKSAFASRRGLITMETKNPAYLNIIGHNGDATASDYKKVCSIYNCAKCPGAPGYKPRIRAEPEAATSTTTAAPTTTSSVLRLLPRAPIMQRPQQKFSRNPNPFVRQQKGYKTVKNVHHVAGRS